MYTHMHTQCTRVYASQVVCMDTRPKLCVWIRVPSCVYGYASQLCVWIRVPTVSLYDSFVNSMVFPRILVEFYGFSLDFCIFCEIVDESTYFCEFCMNLFFLFECLY